MVVAAFNVLSIKSVIITWNRRSQMSCDNCKEEKQETVKHMLCSCKHSLYEVVMTKQHDKVVSEFYWWINHGWRKVNYTKLISFIYGSRTMRERTRPLQAAKKDPRTPPPRTHYGWRCSHELETNEGVYNHRYHLLVRKIPRPRHIEVFTLHPLEFSLKFSS